jgi:hypothetical protein
MPRTLTRVTRPCLPAESSALTRRARRHPFGDLAHPDIRVPAESQRKARGTWRAFSSGMRLRTSLLQIAVLLTAGCGGSTSATHGEPDASGTDASGGKDAAKDSPGIDVTEGPEAACGGCNCGEPANPSGNVTPQQACSLVASFPVPTSGNSNACDAYCASINDAGGGVYFCTLPAAYVDAYTAAVGDGGAVGDAGGDAGPTCPSWSGSVLVQCGFECLGRRTDGIDDPARREGTRLGHAFAARAYLEEVSVHAFTRLERELEAHGAPAPLRREARRARRDEIRHTAMMARLARRFGGRPESPDAPGTVPARSLLAIAVENAVEGCVRETYGAVVGLIEAGGSSDREVRRAMESIGADECRHAELAWAVAEWVMPRLTAEERAVVRQAARDAVADLARSGHARVVEMLDARVWQPAA